MNAFYCSCHAAAEPKRYAGRPTAVAGSPETRHGVVVTASYEARSRGVRATMTVTQALRTCPELLLIAPDFQLYRRLSKAVFDIVRQYTPDVEVFSIDECWADVTHVPFCGSTSDLAREIQKRLHRELKLPCSIGIAPNKFLAKMASDLHKPQGLTEISLHNLVEVLWPMPVGQMFGVGPKTAERLVRMGISTIGALAAANPEHLSHRLGKRGRQLVELANGRDFAEISSAPEPLKSIGHTITLAKDLSHPEDMATVLMNLADQVGRRVRRHRLVGKTVQLTLRFDSRRTITREQTLPIPTALTEILYDTALSLLHNHLPKAAKVRLLGITLGHLQPEETAILEKHSRTNGTPESIQLSLFSTGSVFEDITGSSQQNFIPSESPLGNALPPPQQRNLDRLRRLSQVTDALRDKYGESIVLRGRMLTQDESQHLREHQTRGTSLQKDILSWPEGGETWPKDGKET
ncbi:DNA polymerase IV [Alicyclobacillaceae bacterium I2511]|nr:DNA polymerase IV [Alicyclobacillaceae bacterium I2511]